MFDNLGWLEILTLLLLALFIIGPERLPKLLGELGKGVRKIRKMASTATADISKEVGSDINIADLHPKTFIRKHVLSEEDEEALRRPFETAFNDIKSSTTDLRSELSESTEALNNFGKDQSSTPAPDNTVESTEVPHSTDDDAPREKKKRSIDLDAT